MQEVVENSQNCVQVALEFGKFQKIFKRFEKRFEKRFTSDLSDVNYGMKICKTLVVGSKYNAEGAAHETLVAGETVQRLPLKDSV